MISLESKAAAARHAGAVALGAIEARAVAAEIACRCVEADAPDLAAIMIRAGITTGQAVSVLNHSREFRPC